MPLRRGSRFSGVGRDRGGLQQGQGLFEDLGKQLSKPSTALQVLGGLAALGAATVPVAAPALLPAAGILGAAGTITGALGKGKHRTKLVVGSKRQVFMGTADKTSGGLVRSDLMRNPKSRKIVSRKQHAHGKRMMRNLRR